MMVEIRYFAGAADAAGTPRTAVDAPPGASVAQVLASAADGNEALGRVLPVCSVLLDGVVHRDLDVPFFVGVHAIDVLPPFAGG